MATTISNHTAGVVPLPPEFGGALIAPGRAVVVDATPAVVEDILRSEDTLRSGLVLSEVPDNQSKISLVSLGTVKVPITLKVDPATGSDVVGGYIQTQTQADEHGPWASIAGALNALPSHIESLVRIVHADGDFSVPGSYFGDVSRFTFKQTREILTTEIYPEVGIVLESESIVTQVPGTVDQAVASAVVMPSSLTLAADPGWSANQYRGYLLQVISGTGAGAQGDIRPIRSHSGTDMQFPGQWDVAPDNTSMVRVVQGAARFTLSPVTAYWRWDRPGVSHRSGFNQPEFMIRGIDIGGAFTFFTGISATMRDGRVLESLVLKSCDIAFSGGMSFDGGGVRFAAAYLYGTALRFGTSVTSALFRGWVLPALNAYRGPTPGYYYLFGADFDDCAAAFKFNDIRQPGTVLDLYSRLRSSNLVHGVVVEGQVTVYLDKARLVDGGLRGSTADLDLDSANGGSTHAWEDVDAAANDILTAPRGAAALGV